jgi:hypothetical protein
MSPNVPSHLLCGEASTIGFPIPPAAVCRLWPLYKLRRVESVQKIKTGLKRGWWLPRKQKNTVHMQKLSTCDSNFQFSQQSLTAFESLFNFPNQCTTHKRMQRPETFYRTKLPRIDNDNFGGGSPVVMLLHQHSDYLFSRQPLTAF